MSWDRKQVYGEAHFNMVLKEPFWSDFTVQLQLRWTNDIPTLCVSQAPDGINVTLCINEDFFMQIGAPPCQKYTVYPTSVLKHEVMHVGFGHHLSIHDYKDKRVANLAMDCLVNCYIPSDELPDFTMKDGTTFKCVTIASFPELNLEAKKDTRYYYDKLMQAKEGGGCEALEGMLGQMAADGFGDSPMEHKLWKTFGEMTDSEKELMTSQIGQALVSAYNRLPADSKHRGLLPGEISERIGKILNPEPPKFDWRGFVRRFISNSEVCGSRKTRRKDNERFYGNPALKVLRKKNAMVAIDTSGSVSTAELEEFVAELTHLHKCGTNITVVQCDAAITDISKFTPGMDFNVHGRGGTSFDPALSYYMEHARDFTCLVYFTDGEAPMPSWFKGNCLWVLSNRSGDAPHLKPFVVRLEK